MFFKDRTLGAAIAVVHSDPYISSSYFGKLSFYPCACTLLQPRLAEAVDASLVDLWLVNYPRLHPRVSDVLMRRLAVVTFNLCPPRLHRVKLEKSLCFLVHAVSETEMSCCRMLVCQFDQ